MNNIYIILGVITMFIYSIFAVKMFKEFMKKNRKVLICVRKDKKIKRRVK